MMSNVTHPKTPEGPPATNHWFVVKSRFSPLPFREMLTKAKIEFFLPTRSVFQNVGARRVHVERPLVFNFIFVNTNVLKIKDFVRHNEGISLVYRHKAILDKTPSKPEQQLLIVPDGEMNMFMRTVGQYTTDIPFFQPSELDLEKGDHVRITDGPFAGVEGVLMSQQGKDGGRVMVCVSDFLALPTLDIEPEYLEIIAFAPSGKHMYKKFDSFMPRARKALEHHRNGGIDDDDRKALTTFIKRFSSLQTNTVNMQMKLLVYKLICYTCLGNEEGAKAMKSEIEALLPKVKSEKYRTLAQETLVLAALL